MKNLLSVGLALGLASVVFADNQVLKIDACGYQVIPANDSKNKGPNQFDEDEFMKAISLVPSGIAVWFNDDTPLTLGIRRGYTKVGATTTPDQGADVPVSATPLMLGINGFPESPANADGYDDEGRPSWPVIFVSDVTVNAANKSGDMQNGGTPINPSAVFGTWIGSRKTNQPPQNSSFTPDVFPAMNGWAGLPDTPPGGFASYTNEGFGAEVVFPTGSLTPGHSYRVQAIFHDGDSKDQGGEPGTPGGGVGGGGSFGGNGLGNRGGILDVGEACQVITVPNACSQGVRVWYLPIGGGAEKYANNVCTCPSDSPRSGQAPLPNSPDVLGGDPTANASCGGGESQIH